MPDHDPSLRGLPRIDRVIRRSAACTAFLFSVLLVNGWCVSPAAARTQHDRQLPFTLFGSPEPLRGAVAPGVFAAAAQDTVYFGGTFWNPDSARWEALRDSAWTFDTGVGSSMVPPGGSTYPGVNPYKEPGLHQTMEGWIGIDNTYSELTYFRRLSTAQTPCVGSGSGLSGSWSFYAGVLPAEAGALCYVAGAGYGNDWNICVGKSFTWTGGQVHLTYEYRNDSEPNYDYANVICDTSGTGQGDVTVTAYTGPVSGTADLTLTPGVTLPTLGPKTVVIKFCASSDGAYSDQDGNYSTECGMFALDDVALTGGIVQPLEDFETGDAGWALLPAHPGPGGEWSNVVSLNDLPPRQAPCLCAMRDSVLVFEDLDAGGHGLFQDNLAASPWIDLKGNGAQTPGKFVRFQVYAELPLLNYIFAQVDVQWYPDVCYNNGKLVTSPWTSTGFVFYWGGTPVCLENGSDAKSSLDFSARAPAGAEEMRIAVGILSYCRIYAECTGISNSTPWFDRIALGTYGVQGAPYIAAGPMDLPQDSFPEDGSVRPNSPGRVDCNTVKGAWSPEPWTSLGDTLVVEGRGSTDPMEVRVQFAVRPGPGINATRFQAWLTKHQYEETKDGLPWYSARMDTAEQGQSGAINGIWMTAYHESDPNFLDNDRALDPFDRSPRGSTGRLLNDIFPDDLFTPGSRLMLFYEAHYIGSPLWYLFPDTTGGNVLEMEVLPSSMEADGSHNAVLLVDHADGMDDDGLLDRALAEALPGTSSNVEHTVWDRYDVRAAASRQASFGRPRYTEYGAGTGQVIDYETILWDGGGLSSGCLTREDADILIPWLTRGCGSYPCQTDLCLPYWHYCWPAKHLYLSGDGLVSSVMAESFTDPGARSLLWDYAAVDLRCSSFRSMNCPMGSPADPATCAALSPVYGALVADRHRTVVQAAQGNGCPELRRFDVLGVYPGANPSIPAADERYAGSVKAAPYASLSNDQPYGDGYILTPYKTVVDGVALRHRRDAGACVADPGAPPTAMVTRLQEVLGWFSRPDTVTGVTGIGDGPLRTALVPVAPNPIVAGAPAHIGFTVPRDQEARVEVYDVSGRSVRTVFSGLARRGDNEAVWDLKDALGTPVGTGMYFVRLATGGTAMTRTVVVAEGR